MYKHIKSRSKTAAFLVTYWVRSFLVFLCLCWIWWKKKNLDRKRFKMVKMMSIGIESIIGCTLDSTWDFIHWVVSSGLWVGYTCMYSRLNLIGLGDCPSSPLHDTVSFLEAQNTPGIGYIVRLKLESNTITFWWFSMWNNGLFYLSFYSENKM